MRKHYLDNIRWVTVLLVMFFHVFYHYNTYCAGTGIGGFSDYQPQDAVLYLLYPWMMPLLFVVAGMSARYALRKYTLREYLHARTRKLLVPTTLGLFVFQWIAGYLGMLTMNYRLGTEMAAGQPWWVVYIVCAISGGGGLWFVQLLWLFSLLTAALHLCQSKIEEKGQKTAYKLSERQEGWLSVSLIVAAGLLLYLADQSVMDTEGGMQDPASLYNLYRPLYYLTAYLLGYCVFVRESVQEWLRRLRWVSIPAAVICGICLTVFTFGEDCYSPDYLRGIWNNLYAWLAIVAMLGGFRQWCDRTSPAAMALGRMSYGLYVLQFIVYFAVGYLLRVHTGLAPWAMYVLLGVAMFTLTPALYAVIHRIPILRYCVLGEKK